jgi:putative alpha-1,2-mannosidase
MDYSYGINGNGLPGNDDYATMSAWLIFGSLGFYPLPSENIYILGSPAIHNARIYRKMGNGELLPFNVNVKNNSVNKYRIDKVSINQKNI